MSEIEKIKINFILPSGELIETTVPVETSVMEGAHNDSNVGIKNLEGACEGSLACSTCHVIMKPDEFAKLEPATESEEDMLDLAFGVTSTSRLCCQIIASKQIEGFTFQIPVNSKNIK